MGPSIWRPDLAQGPSAPYWVLLRAVQWEPKVTAGPTNLNLWLLHLARIDFSTKNQSRFICRFNTCKTDRERVWGVTGQSGTWVYRFVLDHVTHIVHAEKDKKKKPKIFGVVK